MAHMRHREYKQPQMTVAEDKLQKPEEFFTSSFRVTRENEGYALEVIKNCCNEYPPSSNNRASQKKMPASLELSQYLNTYIDKDWLAKHAGNLLLHALIRKAPWALVETLFKISNQKRQDDGRNHYYSIGEMTLPQSWPKGEYESEDVSPLFIASLFSDEETIKSLVSQSTAEDIKDAVEQLYHWPRGYSINFKSTNTTYISETCKLGLQRLLDHVKDSKLVHHRRSRTHIKACFDKAKDFAQCMEIYSSLAKNMNLKPKKVCTSYFFCRTRLQYLPLTQFLLETAQQKIVELVKNNKTAAIDWLQQPLFDARHNDLGVKSSSRGILEHIKNWAPAEKVVATNSKLFTI